MSSGAALGLLRSLIEERTGYHYSELHLPLLIDRLTRRVTELQLRDLMDYFYFLSYDSDSELEWSRLYAELVVPETFFCREFEALRTAVTQLLPQSNGKLRIWHAGCSSGEEPYTMAMLLEEHGLLERCELLATDLDERALLKARQGLYGARSLRCLRPDWLASHFEGRPEGRFQLNRRWLERVRFQKLNLMDASAVRAVGPCDLVLCRNVFIYFSPSVIERVVAGFAELLRPGGHLLIGVCESLLRVRTSLQLTQTGGVISYRKPVVS